MSTNALSINRNNALVTLPVKFIGLEVKTIMGESLDLARKGLVTHFVFDFSSCEMIDSSGIGLLVTLTRELKSASGDLVLRNPGRDILQMLSDTGLDRIFSIEKNGGVRQADVDLFPQSVDIKLNIERHSDGDKCIFVLRGVMNHPMGSSLFRQQLLLSLAEYRKILLDMEELTFFDSLSLGTVLNMNILLKKTGGALRICGPNYIVTDLFKTLSIDQIVPVFETREKALEGW
ncbi:MAG TPA: STAS domain-containing protein [Chitinispirillaceae bacterium]|nr:STAS domain-containing protein [Chitinispirillaceae bacterium]